MMSILDLQPEDGGDTFLRNVGVHPQDYIASQARIPQSTETYSFSSTAVFKTQSNNWVAERNMPSILMLFSLLMKFLPPLPKKTAGTGVSMRTLMKLRT
jgi:hypothetical protein